MWWDEWGNDLKWLLFASLVTVLQSIPIFFVVDSVITVIDNIPNWWVSYSLSVIFSMFLGLVELMIKWDYDDFKHYNLKKKLRAD